MNYYQSHRYLYPNPRYIHQIKPSVNHWQLRDLIHYSDGSVYYTKNDSIRALNLTNYQSSNHVLLDYFPRCFAIAPSGITVTGGLLTSSSNRISKTIESISYDTACGFTNKSNKGLFTFHNPEMNISKTAKIGEVINNDVTVYQSSENSYSSYVCNNDTYLYCLSISNRDSITVTNRINCETNTCLNNVVKNPTNDKMLTVTGDSKSIFMVDPTSTSPITNVIKSCHDSGFGIAYHPNGQVFSTVFQDGSCLLYDIRNLSSPLLEIKSTRHGHQLGAFRVCKFSPENDMNDLLIISEHVGRVHLIDLRLINQETVDNHQVIVVPYALEQQADYISDQLKQRSLQDGKNNNEPDSSLSKTQQNVSKHEIHTQIEVFSDEIDNYPTFTAPLVYDYNYLLENPKIFKDFNYTPPSVPVNVRKESKKLNCPILEDSTFYNYDNEEISSSQRAIPLIDVIDDLSNNVFANSEANIGNTHRLSNLARTIYEQPNRTFHPITSSATYDHEKLQFPISQVQGEMEIAGIEFCSTGGESRILIGGQDAAILEWKINGAARRSFSVNEYA